MSHNKGLSLREAARRIGIHHVTLRRWIDDGEGPPAFVKSGPSRRTIRIPLDGLETWMAAYTEGPSVHRLEKQLDRQMKREI